MPNALPERQLLVAMLRRALFDYFSDSPEERRSAREWLFEKSDSLAVFSFDWICQQLDLDPNCVLSSVRRINRQDNVTTQQWWGNLHAIAA